MLRAVLLATVAAVLAAVVTLVVAQVVLAPDELPAVDVAAPEGGSRDPDLDVEDACTRLASRLPDQLAGLPRRGTTAAGVRVAAWGEPAVVLRCGVVEPRGAGPSAEVVEIDDVLFLPGPLDDGRPGATVVDRAVYVELAVPDDLDAAPVYLALAEVVDATLPVLLESGAEVPAP